MLRRCTQSLLLCVCLAVCANAQKGPETLLTQLPQDHPYQKTLRAYMATLTAKDFDHGVNDPLPIDSAVPDDGEYQYRQYCLTLMHQPLIGSKRGVPSITCPPDQYTLAAIETPQGVLATQVWPETMVPFLEWDYPGNAYRNSRALKLRAFVGAVVQMTMFHQFAEANDSKVPPPIRPDWHGYNPVFWASAYPGFKDVLPTEVQKAFEDGLKMVGERVMGWGVKGEAIEHDLMMPLGLCYIAKAIDDDAFTAKVKAYVGAIYKGDRFHPAGYWVERGGIDTGFGGTANLFTVWTALLTDWDFAKANVDKAYRLRGHLILPEPDGTLTGPSHFNSRLGSPTHMDQFAFDYARDTAASMVTDHAAWMIPTPTAEQLKEAAGKRAYDFNEQIGENPRVVENGVARYIDNDEVKNAWPWKLRMWMTYNFPVSVNPSYSLYKDGAWKHRTELVQSNSPLLKSPYLRGETFVRNFGDAFIATRQPTYAAILHTGPIGSQHADDNMHQFPGPMGLSGGSLSAFWTPQTGAVLMGLRRGMSYDKSYDDVAEWRTWPVHAVSGVNDKGVFFTSARITKPEVVIVEGQSNSMTIATQGVIPASIVGQDGEIAGEYAIERQFKLSGKNVHITTTVTGDGNEAVAELYEVLPVYLREVDKQRNVEPTKIAFNVGGTWQDATAEYRGNVSAVKLTRFGHHVLITFDKPQRVKLSPTDWLDTWFTKNACRNVLIDLLGSDTPTKLGGKRSVSYRIEASPN